MVGGIINVALMAMVPMLGGFVSLVVLFAVGAVGGGLALPSVSAIAVEEGRKFGMGTVMGTLSMVQSLGLALWPTGTRSPCQR
jgi:hypothetical protein